MILPSSLGRNHRMTKTTPQYKTCSQFSSEQSYVSPSCRSGDSPSSSPASCCPSSPPPHRPKSSRRPPKYSGPDLLPTLTPSPKTTSATLGTTAFSPSRPVAACTVGYSGTVAAGGAGSVPLAGLTRWAPSTTRPPASSATY
ncbi:hypothetical protein LY76DRAFT_658125, partial [Colletotrichum caudatum]